VGELIDLSIRHFDRRPPRTLAPRLYRRLVHPLLVRASGGRRRVALRRSEPFFPYFAIETTFGTSRAQERLAPAGLRPSPLPTYFGRLVDYALAADWGKRPLTRAEMIRGEPATPGAVRAA
jgi:hypothetical protein